MGATGCNLRGSPAPSATVTPSSISKVKGQYTKALMKAKEWQPNATLERVYREFNGSLTPDDPPPLVFVFASLAEPNKNNEITIKDEAAEDHQAAKPAAELMYNPVDIGDWQIDPEQALKIAEDAGGRRFREEHLAGYKLLQQLSKIKQHPTQWMFRYTTGAGSRLKYEIFINAKTGTVDSRQESKL